MDHLISLKEKTEENIAILIRKTNTEIHLKGMPKISIYHMCVPYAISSQSKGEQKQNHICCQRHIYDPL